MSEEDPNTDLIIGISAGLGSAALIGILVGIAVACQRQLKRKDAEEEKRHLDEDSASIAGSEAEQRARTISTQTPISKGTQTPTAVYATPSSKLGMPTGYGYGVGRPRPVSSASHPITGLPHVTLKAMPEQNVPSRTHRSSARSDQPRMNHHPGTSQGASQPPRRGSDGHVTDRLISQQPGGPSYRPEPQLQARARPPRTSSALDHKPYDNEDRQIYERSARTHTKPTSTAARTGTSSLQVHGRSGSLDRPTGKQAVIKELQKNYPTKPIPKLNSTERKEADRKERYIDNWLGEQGAANSVIADYGSVNGIGDRTWDNRMRQTLVNIPPSGREYGGSSGMIPRLDVRL